MELPNHLGFLRKPILLNAQLMGRYLNVRAQLLAVECLDYLGVLGLGKLHLNTFNVKFFIQIESNSNYLFLLIHDSNYLSFSFFLFRP